MTESFVVKLMDGRVKLYKSSGAYVREVCSNASSAVVSGDEVHVTLEDGRVKIYGVNGAYKREI